MSNILFAKYSSRQVDALKTSIANTAFVGVGQPTAVSNDGVAATVYDTVDQQQSVYSNLVAGVRVTSADVVPMIDRRTWSTGEVFEQYNRFVVTACFVCVELGSTKYVYKCLGNNQDSPSTQVPSGTDTQPFETSDGYTWQYIFSIDEDAFNRFATATLIPYIEDADVTNNVVGGTIDAINIIDSGLGYTNVTSGTLRGEDISTGNQLTYKLGTDASATNDFYNGCMFEIITPTSPAFGQLVEIVDYDGSTKTLTLASALPATPEIGDAYEVSPGVSLSTNSQPSSNAAIRAEITDGRVTGFIFGERGSGYRETTATINADATVGATPAVVAVTSAPSAGHGADVVAESIRQAVCIQKDIILDNIAMEETNDIRSVALIDSPLFDAVSVTLTSGNPERFAIGEEVVQYQRMGQLSGNTVFTSPSSLTANTEQLRVGEQIEIVSGNQNLIVTVTGISNSTTATASGSFAGSFEGTGYQVNAGATGVVRSRSGSDLVLTSSSAQWVTADRIYGRQSRSVDDVSQIAVDGRSTLNAFNQTARLSGSFSSGIFVQDEQVIGDNGSIGYVFSINGTNNLVSLTNITGSPSAQTYTGQSSGAVFNATSVVNGDLVLDSGEMLFVNTTAPISIAANKKISTKIVIEL